MNERVEPASLAADSRLSSGSPVLFDNSLSILNRTGAYYIAKDLCQEFLPRGAGVRHWRLRGYGPEGLARKIAARLMMLEIKWLGCSEKFLIRDRADKGGFRVFLDPLYVLRSRLTEGDIVLCHDVGPLTHSSLYDANTVANYRLAYEKIRQCRPGIVFVSDFSANHFRFLFGNDFRFLKTISLYVRTELFDGSAEAVPGLDGPFFLTVGAFEKRKNHMAALMAYRDAGFHERGVNYVLCGSRGDSHAEIVDAVQKVPGAILMGYVPDSQLRWLYAKAAAFVLPSSLEGFGMPALEAAYMGLLPIVTADSALVEAAGGICVQVAPNDPQAIASAMKNALLRSDREKGETSRALRNVALTSTKERFLRQWAELLAANQNAGR